MSEIDLDDIERFSKKHGPEKSSRLLSALGKDKQFINAWETPAGKEILGHLLLLVDIKLDLIIAEKADEKDRAEYRVCLELLRNFQDRINSHAKNLKTFKEG